MRAVVQRVSQAAVAVDGQVIARIEDGLVVLLGVGLHDTSSDAEVLADKIASLRIFADDEGAMNRSVLDVDGEALVVSQFTLCADVRKGRRPSLANAAPSGQAEPLLAHFMERLGQSGVPVSGGRFGAHMVVSLTNDGPVTIVMESAGGRLV